MGANPTAAIVVGILLVLAGLFLVRGDGQVVNLLGWVFIVVGVGSAVLNFFLRNKMRRR